MGQGRVDMEPVLVRIHPATQPPSQAVSSRSTMQPSLDWLSSTIADLGVSRGSWPAAGATGPQEQVDALALLARTQALTSQSLQQVAEGLTCWTDTEMKHLSKDWPVIDGQVFHYIAWKREWMAHHRQNYPGLQGDALRRVLVDRCLRPVDRERVRYRSTVAQVWEYLDRAYQRQDVFLHDLMKPVLAHREITDTRDILYCAYVSTSYSYSLLTYSMLINRYLSLHYFIIYQYLIRLVVVKRKVLFLILNRVQVFPSCYLLNITIIKSSQ
jgi:hypothetical protein